MLIDICGCRWSEKYFEWKWYPIHKLLLTLVTMCLKRETWLSFFVPFLAQSRLFLEPFLKATPSIPYWVKGKKLPQNMYMTNVTPYSDLFKKTTASRRKWNPNVFSLQKGKRPAGVSLWTTTTDHILNHDSFWYFCIFKWFIVCFRWYDYFTFLFWWDTATASRFDF